MLYRKFKPQNFFKNDWVIRNNHNENIDKKNRIIKIAKLLPQSYQELKDGVKYRKLKGIREKKAIFLPTFLERGAKEIIQIYRNKNFNNAVKEMTKSIIHSQLPPEESEIQLLTKEVEAREAARDKILFTEISNDEKIKIEKDRNKRVFATVQNRIKSWKEIVYDDFLSCAYLASRLSANYAALYQVLMEIKTLDPLFKPKTLFDFGSGLGTTMWAVNQIWPKTVNEHFNVDLSKPMNDLADLLLRLGNHSNSQFFNNVFFRQFLPVNNTIKYDLVISAFTLKELPNTKTRINAIENLWNKTNDLLVIIEHGNKAGFSTILEARNFVLKNSGYDPNAIYKKEDIKLNTELDVTNFQPDAHIMAPCPHHYSCPRLSGNLPVLCNFDIVHWPIDFGQENYGPIHERYSYIVLRKKTQPKDEIYKWPRIVQPKIKNKNNSICRVCASDGKLHELNISKKKFDKDTYMCAKAAKWGDLLPVSIRELTKEEFDKEHLTKIKAKKESK